MNLLMATIPKKSAWKPEAKGTWHFFCPQCRSPRRLPYSPKPEKLLRVFQVFLTACIFTLLTWNWFEWKGLVSFLPFWAIFETVYRLHIRTKLSCTNCGFDPYLYLSDVPKARQEIETFWRKKFEEKGIEYPEKDESSEEEYFEEEEVAAEEYEESHPQQQPVPVQ